MTQRLIAQKNIFHYTLQGADIKRRKPERMLRVRKMQCSWLFPLRWRGPLPATRDRQEASFPGGCKGK